jgi:hypothetical protein
VIAIAKEVFGAMPPRFIPAHPIAGKEQTGVEPAGGRLYTNKNMIESGILKPGYDVVHLTSQILYNVLFIDELLNILVNSYKQGLRPCKILSSNFVEDHPRNIPAKFGSNRPIGFGEEA